MRVAIVTGANTGVGFETARGLLAAGYRVVLAVRDPAKGEAAARALGGGEVMRVDVADLASVRAFAAEFLAAHDRLDLLVNNAGIHTARHALSPQGHELTFATNHLGHFLLTELLLPALTRSAPARIVNVASEAHRFSRKLVLDVFFDPERWSGFSAYSQSKLANIMFTYALARRIEGTGVVAHAVHPGSVATGWARGKESGAFRFVAKLASPFLLSPAKGARTSLHAALSEEAGRKNGVYWVRSKPARSIPGSYDVEAQERLWRLSADLTRK